jgi:hypothetical protein
VTNLHCSKDLHLEVTHHSASSNLKDFPQQRNRLAGRGKKTPEEGFFEEPRKITS